MLTATEQTSQATEQTSQTSRALFDLTETQHEWLCQTAAAQRPAVSASQLLSGLVDDAIAQREAKARRRAWQFEIYRASGYSEHHPDYPNYSQGL